MKFFCIVLFLIAGSAGLLAQTNAPDATNGLTATESASSTTNDVKKTIIHADSGVFNFQTNVVVYRGNVSVRDPQFTLTCDWLTAQGQGSQVTNIVATTNVVIRTFDPKNGTNVATADRAEYVYQLIDKATNETLTLTSLPGNPDPVITYGGGTQSGRIIVIHPLTGQVESFGGQGEQAETTLNRGAGIAPLGAGPNRPAPAVTTTNLPPASATNTDGANHGK